MFRQILHRFFEWGVVKLKILAMWLIKNQEDSPIGELAKSQSKSFHYADWLPILCMKSNENIPHLFFVQRSAMIINIFQFDIRLIRIFLFESVGIISGNIEVW